MPIQAHALPWDSLAAQFEYRPANSGMPGNQRANLYLKKQETRAEQVRYFAKTFKNNLDEHTRILRVQLKSPEQYKDRARIWQRSNLKTDRTTEPAAPSSSQACDDHQTAAEKPQRSSKQALEDSRELRRRICLIQSGWHSEQETRPIFSEELQATYEPYRKFKGMAEFQALETWLWPETAASLQNIDDQYSRDFRVWSNERTRSDILKLLIINVARHDNMWEQNLDLETLMLLKHHPELDLRPYMATALQCGNIGCGIMNLEDFAVRFLIFFGLLETMIDRGESRLMSFNSDSRAYMALNSFGVLVSALTSSHEYLAETIPFRMSWVTRKYHDEKMTSCTTLATDLLSERSQLSVMYKWQWKILVLANSVFGDVVEIDWERRVIDQLDWLFWTTLADAES